MASGKGRPNSIIYGIKHIFPSSFVMKWKKIEKNVQLFEIKVLHGTVGKWKMEELHHYITATVQCKHILLGKVVGAF